MKNELTRAKDGTITLKITVPWQEVEKGRQVAVDTLAKNVQLPGFRKGTVPKNVAEKNLSKEAIDEETLKKVLPQAYIDAVKEQKLTPILNPRIHVETFAEGTDLAFTAETTEEPKVTLKDYKKAASEVTAKSKIAIPGKEADKPSLDAIIEAVLATSEVIISKMLIEHEANRGLTGLLEELRKLGMSLDQYLASRSKTSEDIRAEYEDRARKDLTLEFTLRAIADKENIQVGEEDLKAVMANVTDPKQKAEMLQNSYVLSAIIRQQKTLDFLSKI